MQPNRREFLLSMGYSLLSLGKAFSGSVTFIDENGAIEIEKFRPKKYSQREASQIMSRDNTPNLYEYPSMRAPENSLDQKISDIDSHLTRQSHYITSNIVTRAHEDTHQIQGESRALCDWGDSQPLYLFNDVMAVLKNPKIDIKTIHSYVPEFLRTGSLYDIYFGQAIFKSDNTSLYYLNEWNAYCNGSEVSLESASNPTDIISSTSNMRYFDLMALVTGIAIYRHDRDYWNSQDGTEFKNFMSYQLNRSKNILSRAKQKIGGNNFHKFNPMLNDVENIHEGRVLLKAGSAFENID